MYLYSSWSIYCFLKWCVQGRTDSSADADANRWPQRHRHFHRTYKLQRHSAIYVFDQQFKNSWTVFIRFVGQSNQFADSKGPNRRHPGNVDGDQNRQLVRDYGNEADHHSRVYSVQFAFPKMLIIILAGISFWQKFSEIKISFIMNSITDLPWNVIDCIYTSNTNIYMSIVVFIWFVIILLKRLNQTI